jgi:hypothetical protein
LEGIFVICRPKNACTINLFLHHTEQVTLESSITNNAGTIGTFIFALLVAQKINSTLVFL